MYVERSLLLMGCVYRKFMKMGPSGVQVDGIDRKFAIQMLS